MVTAKPFEVRRTSTFQKWLARLRDRSALRVIESRIARVAAGNFGDAKPVGGGVSELRVDYGPGYRIYFVRVGIAVVILLCGGDKSTQVADIEAAKRMARTAKETPDGAED